MNFKTSIPLAALAALFIGSTTYGQQEDDAVTPMPRKTKTGTTMPEDYRSPAAPPPEGQEIRRYAVDDPGTGATNFGLAPVHDNMPFYFFSADRLEYRATDDEGEVYLWDVQASAERDYNKLFFESEGEYSIDESSFESIQTELFYGRAVSSFWDVRAGLRYDFEPDPERAFAVLGVQGLAPQWFEVDANLYLSEDGDLSFGLESEYDILLTQRLILQPRLELGAAAQDVDAYGIGAGFTGIELGLRLRYEISRKFAPYIGVSWESALGETANRIENSGGDPDTTAFVAGVKFWF